MTADDDAQEEDADLTMTEISDATLESEVEDDVADETDSATATETEVLTEDLNPKEDQMYTRQQNGQVQAQVFTNESQEKRKDFSQLIIYNFGKC